MPDPTLNYFTFAPTGSTDQVVLTLTGDWKITGGLEADCNCAEIPYTERSKLPPNLVYVSGSIFIWGGVGTEDDNEPAHALANQWLIDCSPAHIGREPGDTADKVLSYRLTFADHRHAFRPPRGGRLTQGLGNPDPLGDAELIDNEALMQTCLAAMGISASVPSSVTSVEPPRQIEWFAAHAPSELGTLLEHTGHVYCPYSGGGATIARLGNGSLPAIPAGRLISDVSASSVNRLPTTAIFTSAPNAVARTYDQTASNAIAPDWEFVVMDPANNYAWKPISAVAALGSTPLAELAKGLPSVAAKDRQLLSSQMYKVIRLKGDRFNRLQSPVLREVLYPDGRVDDPHLVATVAVQGKDGAWVNQLARLNATTVDGADNMLVFETRLGTVGGTAAGTERGDLDAFFTPLVEASIKPTFTVEDYNADDGKLFAVYGFTLGLGVGAMSEAAARGQLKGFRPGTAIYDMPELRFVWLNDDTNNRTTLQTTAQGMAEALLVSSPACRTIEVKGILPCEIDGRVSEITYSQDSLLTTIIYDGWTTASRGRHSRRGRHGDSGDHGGRGHGDSGDLLRQPSRSPSAARGRAQAQQLQRGGSVARQSSTSSRVPPERTGMRRVVVTPTAAISGQTNRYTGTSRSGKFNRTATGAFTAADLGTAGTAGDCVIWSSAALTLNQPVMGDAGPTDNNGKLIVYVNPGGGSVPAPTAKYQPFQAIDDTLTPGFYSARFE